MKNDQFNNIVTAQLTQVEKTLIKKGAEYATDSDRLHNFKQAAGLQKLTPRDALGGMMIKHTVSVYDMIGDATGVHSMEKWDEKITDHITYLVLLKAVIEEEEAERLAALPTHTGPSITKLEQVGTIPKSDFKPSATFDNTLAISSKPTK